MSGVLKVEDMDSVSSGCDDRDCCYLCLKHKKGALNVEMWEVEVKSEDQVVFFVSCAV